MGKIKKKFKKKVNPEQSNKMIYAVVFGLIIFFFILFLLVSNISKPKSKEELISNSIDYLKKKPGIINVKTFPQKNRYLIIYNSNIKEDYFSMVKYAGKQISNALKNEKIEIILSKDKEKNKVYTCTIKNCQVISEKEN